MLALDALRPNRAAWILVITLCVAFGCGSRRAPDFYANFTSPQGVQSDEVIWALDGNGYHASKARYFPQLTKP